MGEADVGMVLNPVEAVNPVVDSRKEVSICEADGGAWAAKQTFDARDHYGGSKTMRV